MAGKLSRAAALALLLPALLARAADAPTPAESTARTAIKARWKSLRNFTATYHFDRQQFATPELVALFEGTPAKDIASHERYDETFRFVDGMTFRDRIATPEYKTAMQGMAFIEREITANRLDRTESINWQHGRPAGAISLPRRPDPLQLLDFALGLRLPGEMQPLADNDLQNANLQLTPTAADLTFQKAPGVTYTLHLDPARDYAITAIHSKSGDNVDSSLITCTIDPTTHLPTEIKLVITYGGTTSGKLPTNIVTLTNIKFDTHAPNASPDDMLIVWPKNETILDDRYNLRIRVGPVDRSLPDAVINDLRKGIPSPK